ncbi:MAG: tRNA (adenosine(37)-N6)-dimethylallyltransferase MiaA [Leptolinea sp.]
MKKQPIIVIVGPTASGKTDVSIQLASKLNGEIISADSRQFYQRMDIGTAKPTNAELALVPHHLINVANPSAPWSLAMFQESAKKCIEELYSRSKVPFIVGGTGQYVWGLIEGWLVPSQPINPALRNSLEAWAVDLGAQGIHQVLSRLDPPAGEIVQVENIRRTVRALEVIFSSGKRFSDQRLKNPPDYDFLILGITWDRLALYQRVDMRIEIMLNTGLVEEVRSLLDSGLDPQTSAMSAIGYREIVGYLTGMHSLEEAVVLMKRNTRQYIRRQANWFKVTDPRIAWFQAGNQLAERMEKYINNRG